MVRGLHLSPLLAVLTLLASAPAGAEEVDDPELKAKAAGLYSVENLPSNR